MRDEHKSNSVQQTNLPKIAASRPPSVVHHPEYLFHRKKVPQTNIPLSDSNNCPMLEARL